MNLKLPFVFLGALILLCSALPALALTISPVKIEVTGDAGQTLRGEMKLENDQAEIKQLFSSFENFEPSGDTGSPKFVGGDSGLAQWIETDANISLNPGEVKTIPFTITIPTDAEPGGYFSAIFWGSQNPRTQEAGEVAIGGKVGVLILLRVNGEVVESAGISDFATGGRFFYSTLPVALSYRFSNNGGDRVVPLGDITINNIFGSKVATIPGNKNEGSVLPNSTRKFSTTWGEEVDPSNQRGFFATALEQFKGWHIGLYTAQINLVWGSTNQPTSSAVSFIVLPWQALTLTLVTLIIGYVLLRRYNAWIISRSR